MADKVNHPSHYCREGSMECIEEMLLLFGKEEVKSFCKLNAWKYRYRAADKNGAEDLAKSDWYLRKYKELCGEPIIISTKTINPSITPVTTPTWIDAGSDYTPDWSPVMCSTDKTN